MRKLAILIVKSSTEDFQILIKEGEKLLEVP